MAPLQLCMHKCGNGTRGGREGERQREGEGSHSKFVVVNISGLTEKVQQQSSDVQNPYGKFV